MRSQLQVTKTALARSVPTVERFLRALRLGKYVPTMQANQMTVKKLIEIRGDVGRFDDPPINMKPGHLRKLQRGLYNVARVMDFNFKFIERRADLEKEAKLAKEREDQEEREEREQVTSTVEGGEVDGVVVEQEYWTHDESGGYYNDNGEWVDAVGYDLQDGGDYVESQYYGQEEGEGEGEGDVGPGMEKAHAVPETTVPQEVSGALLVADDSTAIPESTGVVFGEKKVAVLRVGGDTDDRRVNTKKKVGGGGETVVKSTKKNNNNQEVEEAVAVVSLDVGEKADGNVGEKEKMKMKTKAAELNQVASLATHNNSVEEEEEEEEGEEEDSDDSDDDDDAPLPPGA